MNFTYIRYVRDVSHNATVAALQRSHEAACSEHLQPSQHLQRPKGGLTVANAPSRLLHGGVAHKWHL
jgi:hypothetical protein